MTDLRLPGFSISPWRLRRSGLSWLHRSGDRVAAREPIAVCHVRLADSGRSDTPLPLQEEQNDLQIVLAPGSECTVTYREELSQGGYQALVEGGDWQGGECIGHADTLQGPGILQPLILAGRRGFENGEGRGSVLAGWHEKVRGFWDGEGEGRYGTVLALGTCEQTAIFRGDDTAFFSWFARAPGPAQLIAVADERCVHSSAVLLQHMRRTPAEAMAITDAVHSWIGERIGGADSASFPAFQPDAARGTLRGRWPHAQDVLFALHLLAEAVGTSPMLERSEVITGRGILELSPPDAVALTLGSELALHYRHRRTGWIIAMHGFRFGPFIGPGIADWLRRDFEPLNRTVVDSQRDLAALADELKARTGAGLLVQNLIASDVAERVSNYSWLGDAFDKSLGVLGTEANLMLTDLTRQHSIAMIDSDALAAELGVRHCPDRFHASRELVEAQRSEVHRVLREYKVPGF
jgi:hypothetical protein